MESQGILIANFDHLYHPQTCCFLMLNIKILQLALSHFKRITWWMETFLLVLEIQPYSFHQQYFFLFWVYLSLLFLCSKMHFPMLDLTFECRWFEKNLAFVLMVVLCYLKFMHFNFLILHFKIYFLESYKFSYAYYFKIKFNF